MAHVIMISQLLQFSAPLSPFLPVSLFLEIDSCGTNYYFHMNSVVNHVMHHQVKVVSSYHYHFQDKVISSNNNTVPTAMEPVSIKVLCNGCYFQHMITTYYSKLNFTAIKCLFMITSIEVDIKLLLNDFFFMVDLIQRL